ncbi:MAG TPA: site-2 protease family protein [Candidatus Saccharicenans sp.]|jgi:Zn-dependent protease|nr:site-2 protease family protein [Candidatus Saccharicenans sp.]HOL45165.1 site-2 protease family protein [Candidatus Saccharicenans sp.]HOM94114.1 site-2 protease family protein [Candidatus Saccharicenans sp.]HOT68563.1 site-2 protease family protein [Candidatus Saccharicenans sp.]HPC88205.1 site-2 protease family protein [Candidatus Saccharicenans sp.]
MILSIVSFVILLFCITIHEASHGWAAYKLGDPTAMAAGRVTLNPVAHIDLFGTIILPLLLALFRAPVFGWAKPVPVNPQFLKNPRRDGFWISLAGPAANILAAVIALLLILLLKAISPVTTAALYDFLTSSGHLPHGLQPLQGLLIVLFYLVLINTYLSVFNLIPIYPLDGSGVLEGLLPDRLAEQYSRLRPFGFFIVLILISVGFLDLIIRPIQLFILGLIFF